VLRRAAFAPRELDALRDVVEEVVARVVAHARAPGGGPEFQMSGGHRLQFSSGTVIQWEWTEGSAEVRLLEPFTYLDPRFEPLWTDARFVEPMQDALGCAAVA